MLTGSLLVATFPDFALTAAGVFRLQSRPKRHDSTIEAIRYE